MQNLLQVRLDQLDNIGTGLTMVHFAGRFMACIEVLLMQKWRSVSCLIQEPYVPIISVRRSMKS